MFALTFLLFKLNTLHKENCIETTIFEPADLEANNLDLKAFFDAEEMSKQTIPPISDSVT